MVAEKLDPTVAQLCFRRNFQTVRNLQKGTTEMSSEGPKMVERSYGVAGNGLKWLKNQENTDDPRWPSPPLRRPVRGWLAVKFHGRLRSDVLLPYLQCVYSNSGRWCLVWSNLPRLANGQNDPTRVHKF